MRNRRVAVWVAGLAVSLAGCSGPIGLYHSAEGGAIAQDYAPPPGANQPYPNLADVPAAPAPFTPAEKAAAQARAGGGDVSPPSPQALAGLDLPDAPPPQPGVEAAPAAAAAVSPPPPVVMMAPPAPLPPGPAVALAFPPGSAILPAAELPLVQNFLNGWAGAKIEAGGFGDGASLRLALARAQRLADALTADHVPPSAIMLKAQTGGTGGFVRLVY